MDAIDELIDKLKIKITTNKSPSMTSEQNGYLNGLADALQIVEDYKDDMLKIGKKYYVLVIENNEIVVREMILYRINHTTEKTSYCFSKNNKNNLDKLVLSSKIGVQLRVFKTYEAAQNGIIPFSISLHSRNLLR